MSYQILREHIIRFLKEVRGRAGIEQIIAGVDIAPKIAKETLEKMRKEGILGYDKRTERYITIN